MTGPRRAQSIGGWMTGEQHKGKTKGDKMKYLCLAYEEESKLNALTRSEWDALRSETLSYLEELRRRGHIISAEALQGARKAATVRVRNNRVSVTDGPFAETKEQLGGFFLVQARDLNQAIQVASRWPSARLGSIEVRPIEEELRPRRADMRMWIEEVWRRELDATRNVESGSLREHQGQLSAGTLDITSTRYLSSLPRSPARGSAAN